MNRPAFLPIVSLHTLAKMFLRRASGSVEGFIVEAPSAGGHNAPPRVRGEDPRAEPIYGPKDEVDFGEMVDLGLPFWIGGSFASPEGLKRAQTLGATGIQAGSIFALCEESGMDDSIKREVRRLGFRGELRVHTNPIASPTGFPFKVVNLGGTLSDEGVYESRRRTCDVSGLVTPHVRHDGEIEYRCPAEPVKHYGRKGGVVEDTQEVRCLCNGLLTTAALGNPGEPAIVTLGDDVSFLRRLMTKENDSYSASDALTYLLGVGHA
ncbi:MAG: hypothetical protein A2119_02095 [Candidatus Colwellbacteria bacterium GWA2_46_10]|nr:MAG: hypothetical protein A2119_02095 [Candidatus Colwellbacteria bacterium GWA2_46_10]